MAKYKVGDKVRIGTDMPSADNFNPLMKKWLGKVVTIRDCAFSGYLMEEDIADRPPLGWRWAEEWISGLAEPEQAPYTVELRFDGMITTATLKRNGLDVKTAEARCDPKDTYSRAEGARVAVERLFEKKRKEDKPKESKPKIGDKFVIVGNTCHHNFRIGEIVTCDTIIRRTKFYQNSDGMLQFVDDSDVKPYKENSK